MVGMILLSILGGILGGFLVVLIETILHPKRDTKQLDLTKLLPRDEPLYHLGYEPIKDYEKPKKRSSNAEENAYKKDLAHQKNTEHRVI